MNKSSTSLQVAAQQVLHQLTVNRLVQVVYEQRLIGNVERGTYVECMIEMALRECHPAWCLTETWSSEGDLENAKTGARIEIKQSAALQTWHRSPCPTCGSVNDWDVSPSETRPPQFSIKQRAVDLYVFAWHPVQDADIADHRRPDQWEFFVVAEESLPQKQALGLEALTRMSDACNYDTVAARVVKVLESIETLKADRSS